MLDRSRWQLSDLQRFLIAVAIVVAAFVAAMSWGMSNISLLLVALLLLIVAGLAVFLLGLRYRDRSSTHGMAYVIQASTPPVGAIVGRADLRLLVDLPGGGSTMVKLRDPSVPTIKWPRPGMVLPVEIDQRAGRPRTLRVRWESVDPAQTRPVNPLDDSAPFSEPFFTDYAPGVTTTAGAPAATGDSGPAGDGAARDGAAGGGAARDGAAGGGAAGGGAAGGGAAGGGAAGGGAAGGGAADDGAAGTVIYSPTPPAADTEPADWLSADWSGDWTDELERGPDPDGDARALAAGFELPAPGVVPAPRPPEPAPEPAAPPAAAGPAGTGLDDRGMGIMLIVSDLTRSVAFYRDLLGFTVADSNPGGAVLSYGGGLILLSHVADMSPVDRRVVHLHVQVSDVDASYRELRDKGVEFVHRPRVLSRGDKLELWAATFRDPDGHAIALTQWRDRQEAPH